MAFTRGAAEGAAVNAPKQRKAQACRRTLKKRQPRGLKKSKGTRANDERMFIEDSTETAKPCGTDKEE